MRIVFLNRFYWPEEPATGQLLTDLAEALAQAGHDVTVITSRPSRPSLPATETHQGVRIFRVPGTRWSRAGVPGKAADYVSYYAGALMDLARNARRETIVVAMTDPPMLGLGAWLVARWRGARVVHWIQDIYPEIAIALSGHRWLGVLRPLRNAAWRHADACVTLGTDMAAVLAKAAVPPAKIQIIANAAPAGLTPRPDASPSALRREWGLEGKFVVAYSGNLGRVHALEPVLAAAERLRDIPGIVFLFVGDGAQRLRLEAAARAKALPNVQFRPAQPRESLGDSLSVADLHLVTLRAGCEAYVFPSKFHGIVAVARPILFLGPPDCEVAQRIRDAGLGLTFTADEPAAVAAAVARLAADAGERSRLATRVREYAAAEVVNAGPAAAWQALFGRLRGPANPLPTTVKPSAA